MSAVLLASLLAFSLAGLPQKCVGRNVSISAKIVGGNETTIEEYPYSVSIRNTFYGGRTEKNICCGSIISENWVLTSAHCVNGFKENCTYLAVRVGKPNNNQGKIHAVTEVVVHPSYTYGKVPKNNIGILKVATPFAYSIRIQPVKVAPQGFVPQPGAMASVVGWGASQEGGNDFTFLHEVSVPIVPWKDCALHYNDEEDYDGSELFMADMICAGPMEGGEGFCETDNGGPLVLNSTQVGVASWSWGCAAKDYPGVYTNVSYFSGWIASVTGVGAKSRPSTSTASPNHVAGGASLLEAAATFTAALMLSVTFIAPTVFLINLPAQ